MLWAYCSAGDNVVNDACCVGVHSQSADSQEVALNYRQLEEGVNRWTLDLEEQEKIFLQQATQVNAWDRVLVENGDKVEDMCY